MELKVDLKDVIGNKMQVIGLIFEEREGMTLIRRCTSL